MIDFTPHETAVREAQALPVMLPGKLVGRESALAQVYTQLKEDHPVLIHGPAGVGKTALAATLASAYTQQPGGVLWMNVDNPRLEELIVHIGRAYTVSEITNSENPLGMIGAVENTLRSNKPFVVIDGRIDPDVAARFVSRCVSGVPLLLVNEEKLEGPWAALGLAKLDPDQASILFKQEARLDTGEHDIDVYGLAKAVNHVPYGIVVSARGMLAAKKSPSEYLTLVQQVADQAGGRSPVAALTTSFRALNGALQGLILMMGATFKGQASAELLSMISGAQPDSVQQAMNILAQLNLVERTRRYGEFYYRLHTITHNFARTWLRGSSRLEGLQEKVRDSVVSFAKQYSGGSLESHNKLAMEMENFLATARWSAERGNDGVANELVVALSEAADFISERGYLYELLQLRSVGTGLATAFPAHPEEEGSAVAPEDMAALEEPEDAYPEDELAGVALEAFEEEEEEEVDESVAPTFISNVLEDEETPITAFGADEEIDLETEDISSLRTSLAQVKQAGDKEMQIEVLEKIGQLQVDQGMENEAIATYGEVLTTYEELEDRAGILDTLDMLSALMAKTENSQAAVLHATRGIKLAQELDETETRMHLLMTLGDARQQLGESEQAIEDYTQALSVARTRDDKQHEALILYKLGYAHLDNSEPETAVDIWEQALALFKAQDKRAYEGRVLGALGSAYGDMDRWAEAVNFHTSALHIAREIGDREEEALQLGSLAYAAHQAEQLGQAVLRYRQALHLAYENENRDNIVSTIVDLARLLSISRRHLSVAQLLIEDAMNYEPNDKDVRQLKETIDNEIMLAQSQSVEMIPVDGTARDYAANAYRLLEE